jgi:putative ABC transport system permease protein
MTLLSRNFARMVLISLVFSTPLAILFLKNWLTNFAYRIDINPFIFAAGGMIALVIALVTISYHVIRATRSNPVKALKYE